MKLYQQAKKKERKEGVEGERRVIEKKEGRREKEGKGMEERKRGKEGVRREGGREGRKELLHRHPAMPITHEGDGMVPTELI
jgi:hypothetical protein